MIAVLAAAALAASSPGDWRPNAVQAETLARGGVVVQMLPDPGRSSGFIDAAIDIRAPVPRIWRLLADCAEAPKVVRFVKACRVIAGPGPAGGWDLRQDEIETAFFLPRLRSLFRTEFEIGRRIRFHCVPGSELKVCDGEWRLEPLAGGAVRVIYASAVASPYPLPDFIIRSVLNGQMADSMRTLRTLAAAPDGVGTFRAPGR